MQSEIVGTPHRHHTGSIRYPLKSAGTTISVGSLYDLSTVLTWNLDEARARNLTMPVCIVNTYVVAQDHLRCLKNRRENRTPNRTHRTMIESNVT